MGIKEGENKKVFSVAQKFLIIAFSILFVLGATFLFGACNNQQASNIALQVNGDYIQWRYTTGDDVEWKNLIAIDTLTGEDGADGREIALRVNGGYIQWQYTSGSDVEWKNLVEVASLAGQKGDDGREIALQVSDGYIQWRYTTGEDTDWKNLIQVSSLVGATGKDGREIALRVNSGNVEWCYTTGQDTEWKQLIAVSSLKGEDGKDGATWLTGVGEPSIELGAVGDLYLDTESCNVYKKVNDADTVKWDIIANIMVSNQVTDKFTEEDGKLMYNGQVVVVENKQYLQLPATYTGVIRTEDNYTTVHVGTKNLFYNLFQGTTTFNGITITISGSRLSMTGTATAGGYFDLVTGEAATSLSVPNMIVPEGTYTIKTPYTYAQSQSDGSRFPSLGVRLGGSLVGISNGLRTMENIQITSESLGKFVLYINTDEVYNFSNVNIQLYLSDYPCESDDEMGGDIKVITGDSENYVSGFIWAEDPSSVSVSYSSTAKDEDTGFVRYVMGDTEKLEIFVPSQVGYVKYDFTHNISEETDKNYDVWRINASYATNDAMETKYSICAGGEWECAIHIEGRDDFSGGIYHGDEKDLTISMFIDNVYISDFTTLNVLRDFQSLRILRNTNLYDPQDHTTIIAEHAVMYEFDSTGVQISQSILWKGEYTLTSSYLAMFPVKRYESTSSTVPFADRYFDSKTYKVYDVTDGGQNEYPQTWKKDVSKQTLFGTQSGIYCSLEVLEYPDIPGALYAQCSPADAYNKLYFALAGIGDGVGYQTTNNEYWHHVSKYVTIITEI